MPKIKTSKEEIIRKAVLVFAQYGYPSSSISMLAKACGLEKAHLYYYFTDKAEIMTEVLYFVLQEAELILFGPAWDTTKAKHERLQAFLSQFETFFSDASYGKIMVNTILQTIGEATPFLEIARTFYKRLIETVAHLYEERYSPSYATDKAEQAVQDLQGSIIMSQVFSDDAYFKGALKRVGKKV